jgi:hypothetical protein
VIPAVVKPYASEKTAIGWSGKAAILVRFESWHACCVLCGPEGFGVLNNDKSMTNLINKGETAMRREKPQ